MNIYTHDGWLDVPHIAKICDKNNISIIVMIGKRQVGKTYGVLKYMLDSDKRFIYLRSVMAEMEMLKKNVGNPFDAIKGYNNRVIFDNATQYTANIIRLDTQDGIDGEIKTNIGLLASLSSIGRVRGLNGREFKEIVYDEFIPESHLLKVKNGGDAFLNMYTTIAGNRELEGEKPLRVWLLANSNELNSEILNALNITKDVERMSLRGEETRLLKERGILIILPESKAITEKRKQTALYRAIGGDSKFSKMAYENEFAYNDYTDVRPMPLQEYNPLVTIGRITIHLHKNDKTLYVTDKVKAKARYNYTDSETHVNSFNRKFADIRAAYLRGRLTFQDMRIKNYFLDIIDY